MGWCCGTVILFKHLECVFPYESMTIISFDITVITSKARFTNLCNSNSSGSSVKASLETRCWVDLTHTWKFHPECKVITTLLSLDNFIKVIKVLRKYHIYLTFSLIRLEISSRWTYCYCYWEQNFYVQAYMWMWLRCKRLSGPKLTLSE